MISLVKWSESHSVLSDSLWFHGLFGPWNSPGHNDGMGSLSFLQGIFPTQGSNPGPPYCRRMLYQLSHQGNPRILDYVAFPFSSGSSWPRNHTGVSCIVGGFFTSWAIREAPDLITFYKCLNYKTRFSLTIFSNWTVLVCYIYYGVITYQWLSLELFVH